jgi:hypothetical protein
MFLRLAALLFLAMTFSSCSVLMYQRTVIFEKSPDMVFPKGFFGSKDLINFQPLGVYLRVSNNPKYDGVLFSPVVPIPLIPWVPGIINVLANGKEFHSKEDLRIAVEFWDQRKMAEGVRPKNIANVADFIFSPEDVTITIGSTTYSPQAVKWKDGSCSASAGCTSLEKGRVRINYGEVKGDIYPEVVMSYKIPIDEIRTARLTVANLEFGGEKKELTIPMRAGKYHIELGPL